jgi:hypothetical protein
MFGYGWHDFENASPACVEDLYVLAAALVRLAPQIEKIVEALQVYSRPDFYLFLLDPIGQQTDPTRRAKEALSLVAAGASAKVQQEIP